jgi:hypothetical protein
MTSIDKQAAIDIIYDIYNGNINDKSVFSSPIALRHLNLTEEEYMDVMQYLISKMKQYEDMELAIKLALYHTLDDGRKDV